MNVWLNLRSTAEQQIRWGHLTQSVRFQLAHFIGALQLFQVTYVANSILISSLQNATKHYRFLIDVNIIESFVSMKRVSDQKNAKREEFQR